MVNDEIGKDGIIFIQRFKQMYLIGHIYIKIPEYIEIKKRCGSLGHFGL